MEGITEQLKILTVLTRTEECNAVLGEAYTGPNNRTL